MLPRKQKRRHVPGAASRGTFIAIGIGTLLACQDATQVEVRARTDVAYRSGITVALWSSELGVFATPQVQSSEAWLGDGEIGDVIVTPRGAKNGPLVLRLALAVDRDAASCTDEDLSRCIVATRRLSFVPNKRLRVPVVLHSACVGVRCDESSTCNNLGKCVSATIDAAACENAGGCVLPGDETVTGVRSDAGLFETSTDATLSDVSTNDTGAEDVVIPTPLPTIPLPAPPVTLSAGFAHACAVLAGGVLKCWGANGRGELGLGDVGNRGQTPSATPALVDLGTGRTAVEVIAASDHTCALLNDATVKCWGEGQWGQLGNSNTSRRGDAPGEMGDSMFPVPLGDGSKVAQIAAGFFHTCARLLDGRVKCWGDNPFGQLGVGDTARRGSEAGEMNNSLPAVDLGTGRTAVFIAAGGVASCAILDNGALKCWGENSDGRLGLGDKVSRGVTKNQMGDNLPAVDLGTGRTARRVTVGRHHMCALLDDGNVVCWGENKLGQLGSGDTVPRGESPGQMGAKLPVVPLSELAVELHTRADHTCARLTNNQLQCWGENVYGKLGIGDDKSRGDEPNELGAFLPRVSLGTDRNVVSHAIGIDFGCARLDNNAIKCWGRNFAGQLGVGDTQERGSSPAHMGDALPAAGL